MRQGVLMAKRLRRRFTEAFKPEAVRLCLRRSSQHRAGRSGPRH